jgi:hypothetical protein
MTSGLKIDEPWFNQEVIDRAQRKRLREMDEAFCPALTAAIISGKEKQPNAQS